MYAAYVNLAGSVISKKALNPIDLEAIYRYKELGYAQEDIKTILDNMYEEGELSQDEYEFASEYSCGVAEWYLNEIKSPLIAAEEGMRIAIRQFLYTHSFQPSF